MIQMKLTNNYLITFYLEVKMTAAMIFLPLLQPEACVAAKSKVGTRKRCTWKPSIVETMTHFIDVQKV